jgi:recombination protein RecT
MNQLITNFQTKIEQYEKENFKELLQNSHISPSKFKQIMISQLKKSRGLQEAFTKNPASLFASILHCAELGLNPSQEVGEFFFIPFKGNITPILGYKGLITLLYRSNKIKKIWAECVFEGDDFEYELGLEPKLTHIPSEKSVKKSQNIKYIYVCAKLDDNDIIFKVLNRTEIVDIIKLQKTPNHLYFNDLKDPQHWMLKKIVLKQLSKTLPKEDLTLQKAISYDDNLESGGYIVVDETDNLNLIKGKVIGKKPLYDNLTKDLDIDDEYIKAVEN